MKKQLFKKIFAVLFISMIFSMLIVPDNVHASTKEQQTAVSLNEVLKTEEKIMCYDAKTNETREVNVWELEKKTNSHFNFIAIKNWVSNKILALFYCRNLRKGNQ